MADGVVDMQVAAFKGHGSGNDILVILHAVSELFSSLSEAQCAARFLCDRAGPLGADGVYFAGLDQARFDAIFLNPDGSVAEVCGNGMRLLARMAFDRGFDDPATFTVGSHSYVASRRPDFAPGVRSVALRMPPVVFTEPDGSTLNGGPSPMRIPLFESDVRFSALRVPNPHLVAVVDHFDEAELVRLGQLANDHHDVFPGGANVSFIVPIAGGELFVRTFERGAGLTLSCGSGTAASICVAVREGLIAEGEVTVVRNVGGPLRCRVAAADHGRLQPEVEGNATLVYRTDVDLDAVTGGPTRGGPAGVSGVDRYEEETAAFARLLSDHEAVLARHGLG
jgi:diaminopimelate epimerase